MDTLKMDKNMATAPCIKRMAKLFLTALGLTIFLQNQASEFTGFRFPRVDDLAHY